MNFHFPNFNNFDGILDGLDILEPTKEQLKARLKEKSKKIRNMIFAIVGLSFAVLIEGLFILNLLLM